MTDSPTSKMRFKTPAKLALEAAFDGGRLTSDGGLLWISEVDSELGVCLRSRTFKELSSRHGTVVVGCARWGGDDRRVDATDRMVAGKEQGLGER